ncbi:MULTISPECIES: ABC transporter substrate-binding protein [unclassified Aureimonas]|uniref:ABC transporter substrate-binding protein n=1 Tax=unclassified Aureimonas TaxID=2615206 RepID=UPI0006F5C8ED|nr:MULTISPECIES: ABC transporter substrate-binding protein [unclassified Aureimonas]KQT69772.1 diguanylate cyclase [Aureimonas sp. Leaf427]KQT76076.1 diguanylate cyclase [Aureimonas sp. Leaf460]
MTRSKARLLAATVLAALTLGTSIAEAAGILTIGRREDSTTFDPIATAQNVDNWVYSNVFDVLVRVDKTGTKLEPGIAESWTVSDDKLTYTFKLRDAKFSDGSPVTAEDAAFSLLRIRDDPASLWTSSYSVVESAVASDPKTLVVKLKEPSVPFLASLALPNVSVLPKAVVEAKGAEFASAPIGSGAFSVKEWVRGDRVILEKNPNYWDADKVSLDGVEWISVPDDNTRMLNVQAGELDAAIFVPFSRVEQLKTDANLKVSLDTSTREDALLINHEKGKLADKAVRQALDMAIDKQAIVNAVTFGIGEVANSYVPKGALYYYADNLRRPYEPEKAKEMLAAAGATDLTLDYNVKAGDEVDEQIAVLMQQQLAAAGVSVNINKVDAASQWDMFVAGDFDVAVGYWTNDVLDPDQKTTFVLGHDSNLNYMTRYKNDAVKDLVAKARTEADPVKREAMYVELQKTAKDDVNWIDLYYSPYINVTRANIEGFYQNPLGRFWLEDVKKN